VAQHLGVSSHFVSRMTGTMMMTKGNETLQFGLNLKNNKKNEEVRWSFLLRLNNMSD